MSFGKEFKVNNQTYLIEIFESNINVAKKIKENDYSSIFEGDYSSLFWNEDLIRLEALEYDRKLYAIVDACLNKHSVINSLALYQQYICSLLESGHTKKEILLSSSDEVVVYENYFPLDDKRIRFEKITTSIIDGYNEEKKL